MMNAHRIVLLLVVVLLLLVFTVPAASEPSDSIIVNNADEVRETSTSVDQGLEDTFANVSPRVVLQYANTIRHDDMPTLPGALQTLLMQMSNRVVIQYANTNREESLVYPANLLDDTTPPQITNIVVNPVGSGRVTIAWTTDEFATSAVLYGTHPGAYTETVSDPLYVKQHSVMLSGLVPETTYYYIVRSTDQSGNTATSTEHSFIPAFVYLPLVLCDTL
jgi:hypothetical protein